MNSVCRPPIQKVKWEQAGSRGFAVCRRLSTGLNLNLTVIFSCLSDRRVLEGTGGKWLILLHGSREFFTVLGSAHAGQKVKAAQVCGRDRSFHREQEAQRKRRDRNGCSLQRRTLSGGQVLPARLCLPELLPSPQTVLQQSRQPVIPASRRLRQKSHEFQASLGLQIEITFKKKIRI